MKHLVSDVAQGDGGALAPGLLALEDLVGRGPAPPLLVVSDGNAGLIRAVKEMWPTVLRQRCVVHRWPV